MGQYPSVEHAKPYKVTIPNKGTLTGLELKSSENKYSTIRFSKVPYALPPKGSNRFKKPIPLPDDYDYTGDYEDLGLKCPQPAVPNPSFNYVKSPSDENITWSNIFVPTGEPPKDGWPVMIYIHGGWLQYSSPNGPALATLDINDDFDRKFILVVPGYRINIFGFLSSKELNAKEGSNFGFWDQRMAIEWTYNNIEHFGGNPEKITLSGLSAGSYSAYYQLAYELYHPESPQIIKQITFRSNCVNTQPKSLEETTKQFEEIVLKLGLSDKSFEEQLEGLRAKEGVFYEDFIPTLDLHTFRAVDDNDFVSPSLLSDIISGEYAKKLTKKGVRIVIGEVNNERYKYSLLDTPHSNKELYLQISNYYNEKVVDPLIRVYEADKLDESDPDYQEQLRVKFGEIVGDGQVYVSSRGYIKKLIDNGFPKEDIYRYRISFRAKYLDNHLDIKHKVIHATDTQVWFYLKSAGFTETELNHVQKLLKPYLQFLNFDENIDWENGDISKFIEFMPDGSIQYVEDPDWKWGLKVSDIVYKAQS